MILQSLPWLLLACAASDARARDAKTEPTPGFQLGSPAFEAQGAIPARFTCDSSDVSPPLAWSGAPKGTRSLALIVDDPDAPDPAAPKMTWVHWVLYDLPADALALAEGMTRHMLPAGTREGVNDWNKTGWRGPCPPIGRHRYIFTLLALDAPLGDLGRPSKARLLAATHGHVLATTTLVGTYQHPR